MVGVYLLFSQINDVHGHLLMNFAQMAHPLKMSLKARSIVHALCIVLYVYDPSFRSAEYKDVLAGASCVVTALTNTPNLKVSRS